MCRHVRVHVYECVYMCVCVRVALVECGRDEPHMHPFRRSPHERGKREPSVQSPPIVPLSLLMEFQSVKNQDLLIEYNYIVV